MSFPTCKATGLPLAEWSNYQQRAVHYISDRVEVNGGDGTANHYTEDAGLFCGDACLAVWLDAKYAVGPLEHRGHPLPCVVRADPSKARPEDMEPF